MYSEEVYKYQIARSNLLTPILDRAERRLKELPETGTNYDFISQFIAETHVVIHRLMEAGNVSQENYEELVKTDSIFVQYAINDIKEKTNVVAN